MNYLVDQIPVGSTKDYFNDDIINIDTSPEIKIETEKIFKKIKDVPLWSVSVNTNNYYPNITITGKISKDGEIYFAENETLNICGYGESISNAIIDFRSHIIYFYKYYKKIDNDKLTKYALRLKQIYDKLLSEK